MLLLDGESAAARGKRTCICRNIKGDSHGEEKVVIFTFSAAADEFWCVMRGCEEQTKKKDGQQDERSSNDARWTDHNQNKRGQGQTAEMMGEGQTAAVCRAFHQDCLFCIRTRTTKTF